MSGISGEEIQAIIDRVEQRLDDVASSDRPASILRAQAELAVSDAELGDGIFRTIDEAVVAAGRAQRAYAAMGLEARKAIVASMRKSMLEHAESLALLAQTETGLGRYEDKIRKNRIVALKTPGPEDLEPVAITGDQGMAVVEWAPFGLVAAITPTTNPTSTIINNSIAIVSAGNAAIFNVHPNAKRVSAQNIRLLNQAILAVGGPPDLITAIPEPTIDSAKELMHHPDVPVLLVTGGPGVVREAQQTSKRAVAAGPGNPNAAAARERSTTQARITNRIVRV